MKFLLTALLLATTSATASSLPERVHLVATDWCPFTCEIGRNGIVEVKLRRHFARLGIELTIDYQPWVRALALAEQGRVDGVVTLSEGESEILLTSDYPIHHFQDCFYRRNDSDWQYHDADSLTEVRLGAVAGYGYGEAVDQHINQQAKRVALIGGSNTPQRLIDMLASERVDAIIAERSIAAPYLHSRQISQAGCLAEQPLYIGLAPQRPWAEALLARLEQLMSP